MKPNPSRRSTFRPLSLCSQNGAYIVGMKRMFTIAGVVAVILVCSGCVAVESEDQIISPNSESEVTPDTALETESEPTPVENDSAECLHGTWLANNDFFLSAIQEFGDEVQSVTGRVTLRFDEDGTLTTDYQDWQISAQVEGSPVVITRAGTDVGTFSVTETELKLADTSVGSSLTVSAAGTETAFAPTPVDYSNAPFMCSPTEAVITTVDGSLELTRE